MARRTRCADCGRTLRPRESRKLWTRGEVTIENANGKRTVKEWLCIECGCKASEMMAELEGADEAQGSGRRLESITRQSGG